MKSDDLEIARILHLKFGNQKSQIGQTKVGNGWQAKGGTLRAVSSHGSSNLRFLISKFEMQDSCDFEIVRFHDSPASLPTQAVSSSSAHRR